MTVEQTSVLDIAYIDRETDKVRLVVADHLPWDGEHLILLQEKINRYLAFIESGEIFDTFPEFRGKSIQIDVIATYEPNEEAVHFFGHVKAILGQAGFEFAYDGGPDGYASPS